MRIQRDNCPIYRRKLPQRVVCGFAVVTEDRLDIDNVTNGDHVMGAFHFRADTLVIQIFPRPGHFIERDGGGHNLIAERAGDFAGRAQADFGIVLRQADHRRKRPGR